MAVLLLLVCRVPTNDVIDDQVDFIEINHLVKPVFSASGKNIKGSETVLTQTIFWDYDPSRREYVVVTWRNTKKTGRPIKTKDGWILLWDDGSGQLRRVFAKSFDETWTLCDHDIELWNRRILDKKDRRGLTKR